MRRRLTPAVRPHPAPAQGATFTDLVFPWFLFIAGCAIPLSMRSGRGRAMPAGRKIVAAVRRGLVIYLLGVLLTVAGSALDRPLAWTDWFAWNILQHKRTCLLVRSALRASRVVLMSEVRPHKSTITPRLRSRLSMNCAAIVAHWPG